MNDGEAIDCRFMMREILLKNCIASILEHFTQEVSQAEISELEGSYVSIKLKKNDRSEGSMFALLEEMKSKFQIKEYNCQRSSLEQIFNSFAKKDFYSQLNKRMTLRLNRNKQQK